MQIAVILTLFDAFIIPNLLHEASFRAIDIYACIVALIGGKARAGSHFVN